MSENIAPPDPAIVPRGTSGAERIHAPMISPDLDPASPMLRADDPPDALAFGPTYARHRARLMALLPMASRAYRQALALAEGDDWQGRAVALRGATALEDRLFGPAIASSGAGIDAVSVEVVVGSGQAGSQGPAATMIEIEPERPQPIVAEAQPGHEK